MRIRPVGLVLAALFLVSSATAQTTPRPSCEPTQLFTVQGVSFHSLPSHGDAFFYQAGMAIDADGAFRAYHPNDRSGLDALAHAGHRGDWWALVTDNGKPNGHPVIQGQSDPAPGFYVSATALYDARKHNPRDPHRYVDAATIPYVVLHPDALRHAHLGDFATVLNLQNGKHSSAIVADESAPNLPVGEASIALARRLGIASDPRHGGKPDAAILYLIYPNSGNGRPRSLREIVANASHLFTAWGGLAQLRACRSPSL